MPVHAFLKGGQAVLMVQKHEKSSFLAEVRQSPEGRSKYQRLKNLRAWTPCEPFFSGAFARPHFAALSAVFQKGERLARRSRRV